MSENRSEEGNRKGRREKGSERRDADRNRVSENVRRESGDEEMREIREEAWRERGN